MNGARCSSALLPLLLLSVLESADAAGGFAEAPQAVIDKTIRNHKGEFFIGWLSRRGNEDPTITAFDGVQDVQGQFCELAHKYLQPMANATSVRCRHRRNVASFRTNTCDACDIARGALACAYRVQPDESNRITARKFIHEVVDNGGSNAMPRCTAERLATRPTHDEPFAFAKRKSVTFI